MRFRILKRLGCLPLATVALCISFDSDAKSKFIEGVGLTKPLRVELEFGGYDYVVAVASQKSADYILSVQSSTMVEPVATVNILAHKSFDEVLLVTKSQCNDCFLTLEGGNSIDKNSPYEVTLKYGYADEDTPWSRHLSTIEAISNAGEVLSKSLSSSPDEGRTSKLKAIDFLERALKPGHSSKWDLHARSLLMQIARGTYEASEIKSLADNILKDYKNTPSVYRSQAYYQLGLLTPDVIKKRRFFELVIRESRFQEALSLLEEVYRIYSQARKFSGLLSTLSNLSWSNQRASRFPQSISYAVQHKLLAEEYFVDTDVIRALYNMAVSYGKLGESHLAEDFLDTAFTRFEQIPENVRKRNKLLFGYLLREKTESALRLGDFDAANDYADKTLKHYVDAKFEERMASVTYLRAEIALAQGEPEVARRLLISAIDYDKKNNRGRSAARNHLRLAELELKQNKVLQAVPHNLAAFNALAKTEDYSLLAQSFSFTIELLSSLGANQDAELLAERVAGFVPAYGLQQDVVKFLYRRAIVSQALGKNESALQYLQEAISRMEDWLPKVIRRDLRRHYLALQKSIFSLNASLLIDANREEQALKLVESFKARTLNETIRGFRGVSETSSELTLARNTIHQEILARAADWYAGSSDNGNDILVSTRRLSSSLEKVETAFIDRRQLQQTAVSKSQNVVLPMIDSPGEAIAYYYISQNEGWLWLVEKGATNLYRLPGETELQTLVQAVRSKISMHPSKRRGESAWQQKKVINKLASVLLGPISERLADGSISQLMVIPDGPINGLPFAPLRLADWSEPLISKVAILYAPSYGSVRAIEARAKSRPETASQKVLVVADPITAFDGGEPIQRLPNSLIEASKIKEIAREDAIVLSGKSASKDGFLKLLIKPYSILHFATHGLLNQREPSLSGLVFSKVSNDINYWLAPEVSAAQINTDLVVLSACETSVGQGVAGEGLLSLSRAFIEGGASQVVGTLWQVQDKATSMLTARFYSSLLDDSLETSEALRRAQMAVYSDKNNNWRDPYFWAGFQLQGGWKTFGYESKKRND